MERYRRSQPDRGNKASKRRLNELLLAEFSPENLKDLLILLETPNPSLIYRQARLESGNFTSRVFLEANNCMGMHLARIRPSTSNGFIIADRGRKVAKYDTWVDGILDFVLYLRYYESLGYDTSNYEEFLTLSGYCESPRYVKLLKSMT